MDKQKKIVISHPNGNANVRGAANGFFNAAILESFHTSIACYKGGWLYRLAKGPLKEFRTREYSAYLKPYTKTSPWMDLTRLIAPKIRQLEWIKHETGKFCIDAVYRDADIRVAKYITKHHNYIDGVYCYEDAAIHTFQSAKKNGIKCIYDLPIGYWRSMRKLLNIEYDKNPDWAITLGGFNDSDEKLNRKDRELALADKIYVASSFTKKTLLDYPGKLAEIEVIPYGFPPINKNRKYIPFAGRKIKVLFVGGLSQRKGISYFFDAIKGLENDLEVTVVGSGNINNCKVLKKALSNVNYIPSLPHEQILALMAAHDLFIFPSLFEGFGLVITEAMSQGTPVITTERTCGPEIIKHGENGWIVEAGTSEPISILLQQFIDCPEILEIAGRKAMKVANSRPWDCYGKELAESVKKYLNE